MGMGTLQCHRQHPYFHRYHDSNLADGSTFTTNGNTFQPNYQDGDGNKLTLIVVSETEDLIHLRLVGEIEANGWIFIRVPPAVETILGYANGLLLGRKCHIPRDAARNVRTSQVGRIRGAG